MSPDREVRITRTFDAPRELVFRAWLDPDQLAVWWEPEGTEVPPSSIAVEPRAGGYLEFMMVDGSGQDHRLRMEILEMVEPELLLFDSPPTPEFGVPARTTTRVVFEADGDRTKVTVTQGPHTDEMVREAQAGWISVLDKLEALLSRAEGETASP